jgi:hypothetical protein
MNITEARKLSATDLDRFSGGMDTNYKFCWNGPAGTGLYPAYTDCRSGMEKLIDGLPAGRFRILAGYWPSRRSSSSPAVA